MLKMVTKRLLKRLVIVVIVIGIALPSCIIIAKNIYTYYKNRMHQMFVPKKASCVIKNIFSRDLEEEIRAFVQDQTAEKSLLSFKPQDFYRQLKQQFNAIKTLEWAFVPPQTLLLTIIGQKPTCIINQEWVLGETNELLSKDHFVHYDMTLLDNIWVDQTWIETDLDKKVAQFIKTIPFQRFSKNSIYYHNPWEIHVIPDQSICKCRIIVDEKNLFAQKKFDALSAIFQNLCQRGLISNKTLQSNGTPIAFDLRVKNQIIVKFFEPLRRGRGL